MKRFRWRFGQTGHVYYFAPDTLEWESTELAYSGFLNWLAEGDFGLFYQSFRWEGKLARRNEPAGRRQGFRLLPAALGARRQRRIEQQGTSASNGGLAGCEEFGLNLLLNRRGIRLHGCESQKNINEYVLAIGRLETRKFYVIG